MLRPNYRVLLSYDSERKVFTARVPELPPCIGEGATRSEALTNMERELDALLQNLESGGGRVPPAVDELPVSGEISVKVSRTLQRDLAFQAALEGVELPQLVSELLASALEHRQRTSRPRRPQAGEGHGEEASRRSEPRHAAERGNERIEHEGRFRGDRNTAARFHGLLEDRASFMESVRGLEAESGGYGPSPGRGGGQRGGYGDRDRGGRRGFQGQGQGQDRGHGRGDRPRDRGHGQGPSQNQAPRQGHGEGGQRPGGGENGTPNT
jgi:predicted RNase H-like HicB family nuclease